MTTSGPRFTEAELIIMLDTQRDYLRALISEGASLRKRALAEATINATRRQLWNRNFIGA